MRFNGSLARSVLLLLLLLALLPAAITSSVNYFRSRQLLHDQTGAQLKTIIHSQSQALNQLANQSQAGLAQLFIRQDITNSLQTLAQRPNDPGFIEISRERLQNFLDTYQSISGTSFSQIFVLSKDGKVLVSTNSQWIGKSLPLQGAVSDLIGSEKVLASYNMSPMFSGRWMIFSSRPIQVVDKNNSATVVGAIQSPILVQLLQSTEFHLPHWQSILFYKEPDFPIPSINRRSEPT